MIAKSIQMPFALLLVTTLSCSTATRSIKTNDSAGFTGVTADAETDPVTSGGDAADDICIWVDTHNPGKSLIIGTDKNDTNGSLTIYDLSGRALFTEPVPDANNVDLRNGFFPDTGSPVPLVVTDRAVDCSVLFFSLDTLQPALHRLTVTGSIGITPYGICFYVSPETGKWFIFVTERSGTIVQASIEPTGRDTVALKPVRTIRLSGISEGCVADDANRAVYIAEENRGIWRFGAEPEDDSTDGILIDSTGSNRIRADIEGLTMFIPRSPGSGYLIASIQGNSSYAVYDRQQPHAYRGSFCIEQGETIDAVTKTDGIDVTSFPLGALYPEGLFVAQDDRNDTGAQNFKLVSWEKIKNALGL